MAIDILTNNALKATPEALTRGARKVSASGQEALNVASDDSVMLTNSAKTLARATDIARAADGVDQSKVASIKQALKDGTYTINYESVANRIIDSEKDLASIFGN